MDTELLKALMPIITFILGIFSVPIVEKLRSIPQDSKHVNGMREEFHDEVHELINRIKEMSIALTTLAEIKNKTFRHGGTLKYIPRDTLMLFLEKTLISNYTKISRRQRNTLKSIITQINGMNQITRELRDIKISPETLDDAIKNKRNYIYAACCLRHSMQFYLNPKSKKHYEDITDQDMIESQLKEVGSNITYEDIKVFGKISFNNPS